MNRKQLIAVSIALGLIVAAAPLAFAKKNPNPGVLPSHSTPYGMTSGEWGAAWWQWMSSIPVPDNPLFDETGEKCGVGQSGRVFFLAGVINVSGTAERDCTVPAGKALFFPVLNVLCSELTGDGTTEEALLTCADSAISATTELHASIDGVPLSNLDDYRGTSSSFGFTLPNNNWLQFFGFDAPAGFYEPAVSDGFWLMLTPLPPGNHTINFGGTFGAPINFTLDITYNLIVQ